jgi:hypothetical protein
MKEKDTLIDALCIAHNTCAAMAQDEPEPSLSLELSREADLYEALLNKYGQDEPTGGEE